MNIKYYFNRLLYIGSAQVLLHTRLLGRKKNLAPHFFILTSGRSGSTLLRKLLMESSSIVIHPETTDLIIKSSYWFLRHYFDKWEKKVSYFVDLINQSEINHHWKLDLNKLKSELNVLSRKDRNYYFVLHHFYSSKTNDSHLTTIGDKTPFLALHSYWLYALFPKVKFIHLVRDGRDVVLSRMLAFNETLSEAANRWLWAEQEIEKLKKKKADVITLKYEDLVKNPDATIDTILKYLGQKRIKPTGTIELGDEHLKHHLNLRFPPFENSIGKWKNGFNKQQKDYLKDKLGYILDKHGYL